MLGGYMEIGAQNWAGYQLILLHKIGRVSFKVIPGMMLTPLFSLQWEPLTWETRTVKMQNMRTVQSKVLKKKTPQKGSQFSH